jgi:ferredoxin-NADP reductase
VESEHDVKSLIGDQDMTVAQKLCCQVEHIIAHGNCVYTVELRPERPIPRFRPGQFLHLALDPYDPSEYWPESRTFSIASSPAQRDKLRISYSVQGRFTARMEREMAEGQSVWVKLPYGDFVVEDTSDIVLLAGGTGITAFTAFLDSLAPDFGHRIYLAYGARNRGLLIYRDMVERRAQSGSSLQTFYFIERDAGVVQSNEIIGRLSMTAMWPRIQTPMQARFYLSGPPIMIKVLSQDLRDRGVRAEAIRIDAWE